LNQPPTNPTAPPIIDYEGSDYRSSFWENQGREYEDRVERIAMRHLLPSHGRRLLEIGTGFGRLVDLYQGYEQIVLLDYGKSMLRQAQERLGRDPRYVYVAADLYRVPVRDQWMDAVCMVRVMHHVADVPAALRQIARVLRPGGVLVLEFANKRNLKSILRYAVRRQSWSPYDRAPVEFKPLHFDFHPAWMRRQLATNGLVIERVRTVSHFRLALLKRIVPTSLLVAVDGAAQWTGQLWTLTPSVFVRARRTPVAGEAAPSGTSKPSATEKPSATAEPAATAAAMFQCPTCGRHSWQSLPDALLCTGCGSRWGLDDGIYDFRAPT
jgi:SAM-dependent methyltransferase